MVSVANCGTQDENVETVLEGYGEKGIQERLLSRVETVPGSLLSPRGAEQGNGTKERSNAGSCFTQKKFLIRQCREQRQVYQSETSWHSSPEEVPRGDTLEHIPSGVLRHSFGVYGNS